eukprot:TRINITY_DN20564_c0_g1_i3.p3 TRINITY_DN20564_c0_g1~~TRINITY_DN20564_c0_g1_i3.p3  ORF type:complete len:100 (-),score=17.17 TRINITY_DN20564_c0_g1_i3:183-482(-)
MIRRPPRSTQGVSSAASDVYKRQVSLQYGPYDNGPVLVGLDQGIILGINYYSMKIMFRLNLSVTDPVRSITYQPCGSLILGAEHGVYMCRIINENRHEY